MLYEVITDMHLAQFEMRAAAGVVRQLGHGVGQPARAHVVDGEDGIALAHLPAAVDDLLGATLNFRIAPLHGGEVQIFRIDRITSYNVCYTKLLRGAPR